MKAKILFQMSGSIACYKACMVVSRLVQEGFEVQVLCTPNALKFIGAATLEGLTGRPVFNDAFEPGRMMDHIHLAKWADLAILAPATAQSINRLAQGAGEEPLGSVFLAYDLKKPFLIAPSMNQEMYAHPAIQSSIRRLMDWGVRILEPGIGRQACGDVGPGRLMEPNELFDEIRRALSERN